MCILSRWWDEARAAFSSIILRTIFSDHENIFNFQKAELEFKKQNKILYASVIWSSLAADITFVMKRRFARRINKEIQSRTTKYS
jgi:hypothetical protein